MDSNHIRGIFYRSIINFDANHLLTCVTEKFAIRRIKKDGLGSRKKDRGNDYIAIYNAQQYQEGVLKIADYLNSENLTNVKGFSADIEWPHDLIHLRDKMMAKGDILFYSRYFFFLD
ncbi:MAG: hypothetical protein ACOC44_03855 [Promethearchaeia archaeon]